MSIQIEQFYEENSQVGPFLFNKVGLTLRSDKQLKSPEEVEAHSSSLLTMAKNLVQKQLKEMKEERE